MVQMILTNLKQLLGISRLREPPRRDGLLTYDEYVECVKDDCYVYAIQFSLESFNRVYGCLSDCVYTYDEWQFHRGVVWKAYSKFGGIYAGS